ncbi:MAG: hypothetical protein Q4G30_03935 [Actinomycetaceae bacterium]|nr:hypothetical protein [Actinomycetaceae bacterium]
MHSRYSSRSFLLRFLGLFAVTSLIVAGFIPAMTLPSANAGGGWSLGEGSFLYGHNVEGGFNGPDGRTYYCSLDDQKGGPVWEANPKYNDQVISPGPGSSMTVYPQSGAHTIAGPAIAKMAFIISQHNDHYDPFTGAYKKMGMNQRGVKAGLYLVAGLGGQSAYSQYTAISKDIGNRFAQEATMKVRDSYVNAGGSPNPSVFAKIESQASAPGQPGVVKVTGINKVLFGSEAEASNPQLLLNQAPFQVHIENGTITDLQQADMSNSGPTSFGFAGFTNPNYPDMNMTITAVDATKPVNVSVLYPKLPQLTAVYKTNVRSTQQSLIWAGTTNAEIRSNTTSAPGEITEDCPKPKFNLSFASQISRNMIQRVDTPNGTTHRSDDAIKHYSFHDTVTVTSDQIPDGTDPDPKDDWPHKVEKVQDPDKPEDPNAFICKKEYLPVVVESRLWFNPRDNLVNAPGLTQTVEAAPMETLVFGGPGAGDPRSHSLDTQTYNVPALGAGYYTYTYDFIFDNQSEDLKEVLADESSVDKRSPFGEAHESTVARFHPVANSVGNYSHFDDDGYEERGQGVGAITTSGMGLFRTDGATLATQLAPRKEGQVAALRALMGDDTNFMILGEFADPRAATLDERQRQAESMAQLLSRGFSFAMYSA